MPTPPTGLVLTKTLVIFIYEKSCAVRLVVVPTASPNRTENLKRYQKRELVSESVFLASESEGKKFSVENYKGSVCMLPFHLPWS